jgi:hypothetical protein
MGNAMNLTKTVVGSPRSENLETGNKQDNSTQLLVVAHKTLFDFKIKEERKNGTGQYQQTDSLGRSFVILSSFVCGNNGEWE